MPHRSLAQSSFFDPTFADPHCMQEGSLPWLLAKCRHELLPAWLFEGWRGQGKQGRNAWPAAVLMSMLLLRWYAGPMSRRRSVQEARHNTRWRAAMGLPIGGPTPSDKTLRRFERFLRERHRSGQPRYLLLHEHWVRLCVQEGVVEPRATWATDSTPMWCYGATLDTVRLLGEGLRSLVGRYAKWTDRALAEMAKQWRLPVLIAKSVKGAFRIDWKDAGARSDVIDQMARDVMRIVDEIRSSLNDPRLRSKHRHKLLLKCRHLLKVIANDLELDERGHWVVARGTAAGRLVSITDPQARHGRKTRSQPYKGFKIHVVGDLVSGLIAALAVTPANVPDAAPTPRLIARAKTLYQKLGQLLADTAYGSAELRSRLRREVAVELIAPPLPVTTASKTLRKEAFSIDFEQGTATCPNGITVGPIRVRATPYSEPAPLIRWPKAICDRCPLSQQCRGRQLDCGRGLSLHPHEQELRQANEQWKDPAVRARYRERTQAERLINEVTRRGGRQAGGWGLASANLQAHLIAMAANLALLARARAAPTALDVAA